MQPKNFAGKLKTEPNFVDKLCVEKYVFGKIRCEMKPETKLCVEFFKFRKYYAAHNSGLKIWLVSGFFEMAQLFNLKFWLYL